MHCLNVLSWICIPLKNLFLHNSFFSNSSVGKNAPTICSFGPDLLGIREHHYFGIGFGLLLRILRGRWADETFMGTIFFVVFSCFFESIDIFCHWINLYIIGWKKYLFFLDFYFILKYPLLSWIPTNILEFKYKISHRTMNQDHIKETIQCSCFQDLPHNGFFGKPTKLRNL